MPKHMRHLLEHGILTKTAQQSAGGLNGVRTWFTNAKATLDHFRCGKKLQNQDRERTSVSSGDSSADCDRR